MSKPKKPSTARKDQAPSEVGYGKPPSDKQFKKGQSGNPKGRPKGSRNKKTSDLAKNLTDVILAEACRGLPIREGDTQVTIPAMQAVIRSMAVKSVQGHAPSQRLFTDLVQIAEAQQTVASDLNLKAGQTITFKWEDGD